MQTVIEIHAMDMLSLSILILFLGNWLNRKIRILGDNYIPAAVTGGLLFALVNLGLHTLADISIEFEMRFRDVLLLVFFSTVGLSARFSTLVAGGKSLVILVVAAGSFLALQNMVGVSIAVLSGNHFGYGLLAGSVSFAGGHGTAIAWGQLAEESGLEGAQAIGLAFATFGLVMGGLVGGPIARWLMARHDLSGPAPHEELKAAAEGSGAEGNEVNWLNTVLLTLLLLAICVEGGYMVNRFLADLGLTLPGFLTSMFVGILITNFADVMKRPLATATIDRFGEVALNVFLAMSMMAIQLWTLTSAASLIMIVLVAQVLLMTLFGMFVVFRLMGRDYDAVVITAGFAGMGLGATPVAIANMNAITSRFGSSAKAFVVIPLVGAFFIDILNAGTIQFFINFLQRVLS